MTKRKDFMAEGKKRLYKRETVQRTLVSFVKQVRKVIEGETDFPDKLVNVIVFGSYVNSNSDMLHDLDIALIVKENRARWKVYNQMHPEQLTGDWFNNLIMPHIMLIKFLKNGRNILSLHYSTVDEFDQEPEFRRVALGDTHVYLVRNGKMCEENMELLGIK